METTITVVSLDATSAALLSQVASSTASTDGLMQSVLGTLGDHFALIAVGVLIVMFCAGLWLGRELT